MNIKLLYWWDALRDKLWFIPSLFCIAALVLAVITLQIDHRLEFGNDTPTPLQTTGASARIVLGALIGALVTVVGLAFSLTMLSVSQTSSQYGPRLIRLVFDSNVTQYILGLFLGTIVFCMVVLRSIRDLDSSGSMFTPNISILMGELLGAASLFGLLKLTDHMSLCMRAETLIHGIYQDLISSANRLFPEIDTRRNRSQLDLASTDGWESIDDKLSLRSKHSGYLQAIDLPAMMQMAEKHLNRIDVLKRPGDFVYAGEALANFEISPNHAPHDSDNLEEELGTRYRVFFLKGTVRTPRQDIEAGVLELVEAGVRALSPGVNDPMTAINVVDYISSFMRYIANRKWPQSVLLDSQSNPRIRVRNATFCSVLNAGFDQLRQNAATSVAVYCRLLEGLAAIAQSVNRPEDLCAVRRQAEMVLRQAQAAIQEEDDLADIRERGNHVTQALENARSND